MKKIDKEICDYDEAYAREDASDIGWCGKCRIPECPYNKYPEEKSGRKEKNGLEITTNVHLVGTRKDKTMNDIFVIEYEMELKRYHSDYLSEDELGHEIANLMRHGACDVRIVILDSKRLI